ncbi:MAG: LapA family protein [Actinomycetota bacterium]
MDETTDPDVDEATSTSREKIERRWIRFALLVTLAVVVLAFIVDNSQRVEVGFLVTERTTPLYWVLLATAVLGAVVDRLIIWWRQR